MLVEQSHCRMVGELHRRYIGESQEAELQRQWHIFLS